ncbi:hypothetical protein M9H77_26789 [Catharanthus roseus]|uniref:Uncharacterized protein n=1 Tax=Catharanthus roseus TaxID=4058 RepID=A0ACC0ABN5_CATRO|nr:hypothetical protein M9H77_26789 [Catharanthus roseus]
MVNELLQARIEIDESVEMHVEGEMSKEDFGDSMSDMRFEEAESIKFERKDRVEEKERLVRTVKRMRALNKRRNNFGEPSKNQEGRIGYNSIKTISFFPSNFNLCLEIYFKEIKLLSLVFIEHGDHFTFFKSLGTYLERRYFIESKSISCASPRVDDCDFNIANFVSCVLGVDLSSLCYEVSLKELKSLLDSYNWQVSLIDDMCIIAFEGNLFILGPSMTNCLSSHFSLEDLLMSSSIVLDPSCYGFGNIGDTSLVELNIVGFAFEFDRKSLQHVCNITSTRGRRHTMEFEGQGERMDLRMNPFKGGADGMTRKVQETVELLQGPVTRARARRMEEEHRGKIVKIKKMIQDLAWQVIEDQEENFKRSETFLFSRVQMEESKEPSIEGLEASKTKREPFLNLTAGSRIHPIIADRPRVTKG